MKTLLLTYILVIFFTINSYSQEQKITVKKDFVSVNDSPVFISCISQENLNVKKDSFSGSETGDLNNSARSKYTSDRIVVLSCADSSLLFHYPFTIPDSCSKIFHNLPDNMDNDTSNKIFHKCLNDCFSNPKYGYDSDTIYVDNPDIIMFMHGQSEEDYLLTDKREVFNADSSYHYLMQLYSLDELKGICIVGGEFRIKSKEFWLNGKKNETWVYYNRSGQLIHEIEYDQGRVIREKYY